MPARIGGMEVVMERNKTLLGGKDSEIIEEPIGRPTIKTSPRSLLLALLKNAIARHDMGLVKIYMGALIDDKYVTLEQLDRFVKCCEKQSEDG